MHATAHTQTHSLTAQSGRTRRTQHSFQCRRCLALSPTVPARSLSLGLQRVQPAYSSSTPRLTSHLRSRHVVRSKVSVDNRELLTGDCLILVAFCLFKQITAIILHPSFLGFLAPLKFNAGRFAELGSFSITLTAAWVLSSLLVGGYQSSATSDLPTALMRVSLAWLISMPVAACQLVLLTAAEDKTLVGGSLFASALPLAATGPGEPLATAAGVLGLMALWRCFYTIFLDFYNSRHWATGAPLDRHQDLVFFTDTLKSVFLLTIACIVIIQFLAHNVGEEAIESFVASATAMIP